MVIRFLTRRGCPLCEEAYALLVSLAEAEAITVEVVDIDLDVELLGRYDERVPVLIDSEGVVLAEGHITERAATDALRTAQRRR